MTVAGPAISGAGTSEQQWRPFLQRLGLPELPREPVPDRVVVVAPHPDDEVLALGGLLCLLAGQGSAVEVIAVTDGEASHPGGSVPPEELAPRRVEETARALALLGLRAPVRRLGLPDGGQGRLERPTLEALRLAPGEWLLAPWAHDGHPDHEAVGRACAAAARRDGAVLLAYPVWAWHWAAPGDRRLPWDRARSVTLPGAVRERKAAALSAFVSQVEPLGPLAADAPVLPPHVLARFARQAEVVFA